jgi:hypothetical protein
MEERTMQGRTKRRWLPARLVTLVALVVGSIGIAASPAHAQFLYQSTRYESQDQGISNWATYSNGYPVARDPNCPYYAGVHRWSKVWASTYGVDEALHTTFRMQFHTTYSPAVAAAKLAYQNAGVPASCPLLNAYWGFGQRNSLQWIACSYATNQPARWCNLAANHPTDPAVDLQLDTRCPGTAYGNLFWTTLWHEWHNLPDRVGDAAKLYNVDVLAQFASWLSSLGLSINMPVYLDDVTDVGGVSNFDQSSAQPSFGNAWYGYGRTWTAGAANLLAIWYDQAARKLGYDPIAHPVKAHQAVDTAIANGQQPTAQIWVWSGTRADLYNQIICTDTTSPKVRDVVDAGGGASMAALGEDLSGWVQKETGETLCQKVHEQPQFANVAAAACINVFVGAFFSIVDNNQGMNMTPVTCPDGVTYPANGIAQLLGVNLGCNRDIHLARLFSQMKAFLGG